MNMIARARQLLSEPHPPAVTHSTGAHGGTINPKFFVVTDDMRRPLSLADEIAIAVKENTAMTEPETGITEKFRASLELHRMTITAEIEKIKAEQETADEANAEYLKRLDDEKAEAVRIHSDLTAANNARIADAETTLNGVRSAMLATETPAPTDEVASTDAARRRAGRPVAVAKLANPNISSSGGQPARDD